MPQATIERNITGPISGGGSNRPPVERPTLNGEPDDWRRNEAQQVLGRLASHNAEFAGIIEGSYSNDEIAVAGIAAALEEVRYAEAS